MGDARGRQSEDIEGKGPTAHRADYSQRSGEQRTSLCARLGIGGRGGSRGSSDEAH
jgi:hypothetical protein